MQHRRISSVTLEPIKNEKRTPTTLTPRRPLKDSNKYHTSLSKRAIVCLLVVCALYSLVNAWQRFQSHTQYRQDTSQGQDSVSKSIPITPINIKHKSSFNSLAQNDKAVSNTWGKAISDLEDSTRTLFKEWFEKDSKKLFALQQGIPGTGIDSEEEAKALQAYLDCTTSRGEWIYSPNGAHLNGSSLPVNKHSSILSTCDKAFYKHSPNHAATDQEHWNVRPSLKWYWHPSPACEALVKPSWMHISNRSSKRPLISRSSLCKYLRHKNILLVGDSPTHYLMHDLLLDWTSKRPLTCYGDLYCKEHAICPDDIVDDTSINQWQDDARPYNTLPDPHKSDKASNSIHANLNGTHTRGTVLRYRCADSMFLNSSPSHPRHQAASVHPHTGVRDINMYAVADGRRSDVIILYKAPISYPRASQATSPLNKRLLKLTAFLEDPKRDLKSKMRKLIDLSALTTMEIWLPEMMESLRALKAPPAPNNSLIVYRGGWRMQDECGRDDVVTVGTVKNSVTGDGPALHPHKLALSSVFVSLQSPQSDVPTLKDMATIFYNLQTMMQNHLVRKLIAPRLGIPFIDLETATGIWRSGFVGGAGSTQRTADAEGLAYLDQPSRKSVDCLRMCLPSPGLSLETLFLGSLHSIFEWGWGGEARSQIWTGSTFVPVRQRKGTRQSRETINN